MIYWRKFSYPFISILFLHLREIQVLAIGCGMRVCSVTQFSKYLHQKQGVNLFLANNHCLHNLSKYRVYFLLCLNTRYKIGVETKENIFVMENG